MNEEQALLLLIKIFGTQGAADLTELESRAAGVLVFNFEWPCTLTEEEVGQAAYHLHTQNRFTDMVTARCAIDSVIAKAKNHQGAFPNPKK